MTPTSFNKLAIPIMPFFNLTFSVPVWLTGNENTCMCTLEFPRIQRFTELNAWTYIEVRKHQKASTHKKLGVTIKTVVLIVFDITYFLSLSWMMVKMVIWVTGLIMRTEWQVSEGNTCKERSRDEKMKLQENNTTFQNQCEQKKTNRHGMWRTAGKESCRQADVVLMNKWFDF